MFEGPKGKSVNQELASAARHLEVIFPRLYFSMFNCTFVILVDDQALLFFGLHQLAVNL